MAFGLGFGFGVSSLSASAAAGAPSLNFDFVGSGTLDPRITFTRASNATYFNSAGTLTTAGNNVARLDYNPSTLAARGLLIEEQRTNLTAYSEDATQWGSGSNMNPTLSNQTTAPDGTSTADKIRESTANSTHFLSQTQTTSYTSGTAYTRTIFLKAAGRRYVQCYLPGTNFVTTGRAAIFDLQTGTIISTESGVTSSIEKLPNDWYRCRVTATANSTGTGHVGGVAVSDTTTMVAYTGDGTSGVFVWGAQLEAGAFPTSYIPTTAAAATRNADVASVNTLSPWYNQSEGTFVGYATTLKASAVAAPILIAQVSGGNGRHQMAVYTQTVATVVGGAVQVAMGANTNATARTAYAYKLNDYATSTNGGAVVTDTSATVPTVNYLSIGKFDFGGGESLSGHIQRISYYPTRLPNATLQTLTT